MGKDRPKSGKRNRIAKQIEEIISRGEYSHYGVRAVADWSSEFDFPIRYLKVGEIAPNSYEWYDEKPIVEQGDLGYTSAVGIGQAGSVLQALSEVMAYCPRQLVLLGAKDDQLGRRGAGDGSDMHEIAMHDATVLAEWKLKGKDWHD
jgi:hypothetical protein